MMNPQAFLAMKALWDRFKGNHPKFPGFLQAASQYPFVEGTIIEISIKSPNGHEMASNVKISADDLDIIRQARSFQG